MYLTKVLIFCKACIGNQQYEKWLRWDTGDALLSSNWGSAGQAGSCMMGALVQAYAGRWLRMGKNNLFQAGETVRMKCRAAEKMICTFNCNENTLYDIEHT